MEENEKPEGVELAPVKKGKTMRTKSIRIQKKKFSDLFDEKKKNGCLHKILVFLGLREELEESISEEEKQRRYQLAINGWKKVRKMLRAIKFTDPERLKGKSLVKETKPWWSYERRVILPNSKFAFIWKSIKAFLVLYSLLIIPFRDAFVNHGKGVVIADWAMDSFFVCDIFMNFFMAYTRRTRIIKDKKAVIINYLTGQFIIDLLSIFPYYWIGNWEGQYYAIRYARYFQIFQMTRQMRVFWESILLIFTSNINIIKGLAQILNFTIFLCIVGQILAALWYTLGLKVDVNEGADGTPYLVDGWIETLLPESTEGDRYITSLYWTFTTLSTLGYGDYYGRTDGEYLFTMAVEFIGVFIFAYMMSNINNLIQKLNDDHLEILEGKSEELDQWILKIDRANIDKKLPTELFDEIKGFFRNYWQRDHTMIHSDEPFLNQLPRDLRSKLIRHLFQKFINRFNIFFEGTQQAFIDEVVINLVPRKFPKNTDIIKIDHGTKYVYFILKGDVIICSHEAIHKYVELPPGSYFGEHLIFFNLKSSNAFRSGDEDVECMCLPKKKFQELCEEFPESAKVLKRKAYIRRKYFRQAKLEVQSQNEKKLAAKRMATDKLGFEEKDFINDSIRKFDETTPSKDGKTDSTGKSSEPSQKHTQESLLEYAKKLKQALDKIENQINHVEADLTKKMKNIKYYIGYISSIEDFVAAT